MIATIPVAIQPGTKLLQLSYESSTGTWILWLYHDRLMSNGTYLRLETGGGITRITLLPDGTEEHYCVRKGDNEVDTKPLNDN